MDKDDLVLVFITTPMNAAAIKEFLQENNIGVLIKNELQESVVAGWVSPGTTNNVKVYVSRKNMDRAKELIEEFSQSDVDYGEEE